MSRPAKESLAKGVADLRALFALGKRNGWKPTPEFMEIGKWLAEGAPCDPPAQPAPPEQAPPPTTLPHGEHNRECYDTALALMQSQLHPAAKEKDGTYCPCCERFTKYYRMSLSQSNCRVLMRYYALWKSDPEQYVHISKVFRLEPGTNKSRDYNRLALFGLIELDPNVDDDGETKRKRKKKGKGRKSGRWRLTTMGCAFAERRVGIQQYAWTWYESQSDPNKNRIVAYEGNTVFIDFFYGKTFDYSAHMAACLADSTVTHN